MEKSGGRSWWQDVPIAQTDRSYRMSAYGDTCHMLNSERCDYLAEAALMGREEHFVLKLARV